MLFSLVLYEGKGVLYANKRGNIDEIQLMWKRYSKFH